MYKLHLIIKYLRKRRIAWVSLIAVMLCTAMVLVVLSVMGGWLRMFRESFHGLSGDIIVTGQRLTGFAHYERMIEEIEKLPEVEAAVPVIQTFGLININNQRSNGVQVMGVPIDRIGLVNRFPQSLYRQHQRYADALERGDATAEERMALGLAAVPADADASLYPQRAAGEKGTPLSVEEKQRLRALADAGETPSFKLPFPPDAYRNRFPEARNDPSEWPGMIVGAGVIDIRKDTEGNITGREEWKLKLPVTLTIPRISEATGQLDRDVAAVQHYWMVDDSRTQIWQYDTNTVYVPFDVVQRDLRMDAQKYKDKESGRQMTEPARTNELHVKVRAGHDMYAVLPKVQAAVRTVQADARSDDREQFLVGLGDDLLVQTWEQQQARYISAIENEVSLVTTLFGFISIVAVFLIFCIFYMIVVEKTRDIGIIKSVGATGTGVAAIFLGYGTVIGIVGGGLGLLVGWAIVRNINYLHGELLGKQLGLVIWKPDVYQFDMIPNQISWWPAATMIFLVAVASSMIGAIVPAIRAARLNPVESLRFE